MSRQTLIKHTFAYRRLQFLAERDELHFFHKFMVMGINEPRRIVILATMPYNHVLEWKPPEPLEGPGVSIEGDL